MLNVQKAGRASSAGPLQSASPRVAVSASAGTKVFTTTNNEGKVTFHVTTSATLPSTSSTGTACTTTITPVQPTTPKKSAAMARGVPPPVPPNKPVIPPKKSSVTATSISSSSVTGQTISPIPVVISCSNNSQVTTVDHGRPISLEVQPLHKAGQIGSHQGIKFGITISKDKIQISSNPQSQQGSAAADEEVRETLMQVGDDEGVHNSQESQTIGHEVSTSTSSLFPSCLALPEWNVLEKELDEFQQLLNSMASPTSTSFALSSLPSTPTGSWKSVPPISLISDVGLTT